MNHTNHTKGQSQFDAGEFNVYVDWVYDEQMDVVSANLRLESPQNQIADSFVLIPRYPHIVEFMGKKIQMSFVETKSERKLYIATPNKKNHVERQTLSSWRKNPSKK